MRVISYLAVLIVVALPSVLSAQTTSSVTVLLPERFQVEEGMAEDLLEELNDAVGSHPNYTVVEIPPQTISDLLLAVGCGAPDPDCLEVIGEILETDYLIWGEIGATDRAYMVELTLWNFETGTAVTQFTTAVEADEAEFEDLIPTFARGVVYGPVGLVTINVEPTGALVMFDSREAGDGRPIVLDGLELGRHVIRASAEGFFEHREVIVVDLEPTEVDIEMVPTTEIIEVSGGRLWTYVALGSGVAIVGAGVAMALLSKSTQEDFDDAASRPRVDLDELQELQDKGERQALLANIFFGVGGAAIITGIILIFVEDTGPEVNSSGELSIAPMLSRDGAGVSVGIGF